MSITPASTDHIADIGNAFQKLETLKAKEENLVLKAIKSNHAIKLDISENKSVVIKVTDQNRDKVLKKIEQSQNTNKEHVVLKFVLEEVKNQNVVFKVKESGKAETVIFFNTTQKEMYETKKLNKLKTDDEKAQFRSSVKITELKDDQKDEISKAASRALVNVAKFDQSENSTQEKKEKEEKEEKSVHSSDETTSRDTQVSKEKSDAVDTSQPKMTKQVFDKNSQKSVSQEEKEAVEASRKQDQQRQESLQSDAKRAETNRTEEKRSDARQEAVDQGEVGGSKAEDRKQEDIKTDLATEKPIKQSNPEEDLQGNETVD